MITKDSLIAALQKQFATSTELKHAKDAAQTSTKRKYIHKKLVKSNLIASKMLAALEKMTTTTQGPANATPANADGNAQEES